MDLHTTFKVYQELDQDYLSFIYQGGFSDQITDRIVSLSEYNIDSRKRLQKLKKKVSFIMVECFQNIVRHSETNTYDREKKKQSEIFFVRNRASSYYIASSNLIENEKVVELQDTIKRLNSLSKEELKTLYMEILSNNEKSSKGGAGLGMIEMARKSGNALEYDFKKENEQVSSFYLQVNLKGTQPENATSNDAKITLEDTKYYHRLMQNENIFLIYKGNFSESSILPILQMIEENMYVNAEHQTRRKRAYLLLVEILQNISKHAIEKDGHHEGIFLLSRSDDGFEICAGNLMETEKVIHLKDQVSKLKEMDKKELRELYKDTLEHGERTEKGGAGLGLIDIARDSGKTIDFAFDQVDDKLSFFTIKACT